MDVPSDDADIRGVGRRLVCRRDIDGRAVVI